MTIFVEPTKQASSVASITLPLGALKISLRRLRPMTKVSPSHVHIARYGDGVDLAATNVHMIGIQHFPCFVTGELPTRAGLSSDAVTALLAEKGKAVTIRFTGTDEIIINDQKVFRADEFFPANYREVVVEGPGKLEVDRAAFLAACKEAIAVAHEHDIEQSYLMIVPQQHTIALVVKKHCKAAINTCNPEARKLVRQHYWQTYMDRVIPIKSISWPNDLPYLKVNAKDMVAYLTHIRSAAVTFHLPASSEMPITASDENFTFATMPLMPHAGETDS